MSVPFDHAADYYDATLRIPPQVASKVVESLITAGRLSRDSRVLEIGEGTGRIAIPLAKQLRRVIGVDLSFPMMSVLRNKTAGSPLNIDLAQSDVVRLFFPKASFD